MRGNEKQLERRAKLGVTAKNHLSISLYILSVVLGRPKCIS